MAYESGYTHLDGKPCPPEIENYLTIISIMTILAAAPGLISAEIIHWLLDKPNQLIGIFHPQVLSFLGSWFIFSIIFSGLWVRCEYLSRKEAFAAYNHKLSVYEKRKAMVINNGGHWKSEKERYYEMFS